jgi:hypothetical protein
VEPAQEVFRRLIQHLQKNPDFGQRLAQTDNVEEFLRYEGFQISQNEVERFWGIHDRSNRSLLEEIADAPFPTARCNTELPDCTPSEQICATYPGFCVPPTIDDCPLPTDVPCATATPGHIGPKWPMNP